MLKNNKLLFVIDSLCSGGAQRQMVNLAIGLKDQGYRVEFLIYYSDPFYEEYLASNDIPVILISDKSYLKRIYKIVKFINDGNFKAVISFLEGANFITSLSKFFCRNTLLIVGERSSNPNILKSFKLKYIRYFHFLADYIVANSFANLELVSKAVPFLSSKKKKVIYNMIDFSKWKSEDIINDNEERFVLLVAATHQYVKNLKGLIEGINLLNVECKRKLIVKWFGTDLIDGSFIEGVKKIEKYGLKDNFMFFPATKDIKKEMELCDVVGLFSIYEGLPNAICEGMALGKPVLCSKVSDIPLLVDELFLFDPLNEVEIKSTIEYLMYCTKEDLHLIGNKNKVIARNEFEKNKIIASYIKLIEGNV